MNFKKLYPWLSAAVVLAALGGWWFHQKGGDSSPGDVVIRVSQTSTAPTDWEIADALTGEDILKESGVKIETIPNAGAAPPYQALLAGQVDTGGFAWVSWINIKLRGGKIKALYASGVTNKEAGILVLKDSPIHTVKDLKGKRIVVNTLGTNGEYCIKYLLKKNGIDPSQVQLLAVPTDTVYEELLKSGQADALAGTTNGGAWFNLALEHGKVRKIPGTSELEICGDIVPTGSGFTEDFIQKHPQAVKKYIGALEKAKRAVWAEFQKDPDHVRRVYADIAKQKGGNPLFAKYYQPSQPRFISDKDVQWWIDVFESEGILKPGQIKPSDIYTNAFNPYSPDYQP